RLVRDACGEAGPARPAMAAARAVGPDLSASATRSGGIGDRRRETPGLGWARAHSISGRTSGNPGISEFMALTLTPGALIVASAYPDPPFDLIDNGSPSGFDIEL